MLALKSRCNSAKTTCIRHKRGSSYCKYRFLERFARGFAADGAGTDAEEAEEDDDDDDEEESDEEALGSRQKAAQTNALGRLRVLPVQPTHEMWKMLSHEVHRLAL